MSAYGGNANPAAAPATRTPTATSQALSATAIDPDGGEIVEYRWAFSDGGSAFGPSVSRTYRSAGTYTATVTATATDAAAAPPALKAPAKRTKK